MTIMQDEKDTALGELLRGLREQRKLSVKRLAALSGVSRKTIDNTEAGQNISVLVLKRLLRPLGVEEITLRVDGAHEVRVTEGLAQADVRAISEAVRKASTLLQQATRRIEECAAKKAPDDVRTRAEHLIASFSAFVRSVDDARALEKVQASVTNLYGRGRRPVPRRNASHQRTV
jgi:transcriptional regulator with XRE-family HTH domain